MSYRKAELSPVQLQVMRAFHAKTKGYPEFSSDDFRAHNLHIYLRHINELGMLFRHGWQAGWMAKTGKRKRSVVEGSHGRSIQLYRWTARGREALGT